MPDYSKTIIYKICCKDTSITDIYIGSTCNFYRRKAQHKHDCNNDCNYNVYQFIREHGGWDNWTMVMVHEASVENKLQKEKLERQFIEEMKPSLNAILPARTKKEWREQNKATLAEYKKLWAEENKEKIAESKKLWYETNKEIISKNKGEKITCECGAVVSKGNLTYHKTSAKHTKLLQNTL